MDTERKEPPQARAEHPIPQPLPPLYEPPRLEEHGEWQHVTGLSLPIGEP
ncbi:hypothetical protein [Calidithermus chliarophilus]|nr:hypothetical protein [Calidithermus chliarophilus]